MLRGTLEHPKFLDLQARLDAPKYRVAGLLECLWHFTAKYAPDGGIGKWPNGAIARALEWDGNADCLVREMTESGWLEPMEDCRLYVHDWHEHADDTVQRALARAAKYFANGARPKMTRLGEAERKMVEARYAELGAHRAPDVRTEAPIGRPAGANGAHDGRPSPPRQSPAPPEPPENTPGEPPPDGGANGHAGRPPKRDGTPKRPASPEALALFGRFDAYMRECHPSAQRPQTEPQRAKWCSALDRMLRGANARPRDHIEAAIEWLQRENPGRGEFAFVVQSPRALDEKLDRIRVEMSRSRAGPARVVSMRGSRPSISNSKWPSRQKATVIGS